MADQEALLRWLWVARQKGQQQELLTQGIFRGMPLEEAVQALDAPLPPTEELHIPTEASYNAWTGTGSSIQLESPHLGNLSVACSLTEVQEHTHSRFNPPPGV